MSSRQRASWTTWAALVLGLAAAVGLLWRWESVGFPPLFAAVGLLVIAAVPLALLLAPRTPPTARRKLPPILWFGLGLVALWVAATVVGLASVVPASYSFVEGVGRPFHRSVLPATVQEALAAAFPTLKPTLTLAACGGYGAILATRQSSRQVLWVTGTGQTLTIHNLPGNSAYGLSAPGTAVRPWPSIRSTIEGVPSSTTAIGPYNLAGTWFWAVPSRGQIYVANGQTGEVSDGC